MEKVIIYGYPLLVVLSIIFINTFDIIGLIIVACFLPFFVMAVRRNNFESENTRLFFAILNKLFIFIAILLFCFVAVMMYIVGNSIT